MKNLYLSAFLKHAAATEFGQSDPLIKQAGRGDLLRLAFNSTRRGAGRLMGRNTDDASRAINRARSRYVEDGVTKARQAYVPDPSSTYSSSPKFNNRATVKAHRRTADAVEKWAPRAAAGTAGLTALGGTAYGSAEYTRNRMADKLSGLSLLDRLAAAGLLAFNPSSFGDRLRG